MKTLKTKLRWQMNMNDLLKCFAKVRDARTRSVFDPNLEQDRFKLWIPDQSIESNPKRKKQNNKHIFAKIIEVRPIYESVPKLLTPQNLLSLHQFFKYFFRDLHYPEVLVFTYDLYCKHASKMTNWPQNINY